MFLLASQPPAALRSAPREAHPSSSRRLLLAAPLLLSAASDVRPVSAEQAGLVVEAESAGFGSRAVAEGDLVLAHWVGRLQETGTVFDSTRGGAPVRTNGLTSVSITPAPSVPRAINLRAGDVQPGVCQGLRLALLGMRVGGKRTVSFGPELGFGATPVAAPMAIVPAGSKLVYDIELLRVSSLGPDELFKGIAQCGVGGAGAQSAGCADVSPSE